MINIGFSHQEGKKYHNNAKLLSIINPSNWVAIALLQILILICTLQIQFLCVSKDIKLKWKYGQGMYYDKQNITWEYKNKFQ